MFRFLLEANGLFQDHHLARLAVVTGLQTIEINPTGYRFTYCIASIPVDSLGRSGVVTGFLPTQFQFPNPDGLDRHRSAN